MAKGNKQTKAEPEEQTQTDNQPKQTEPKRNNKPQTKEAIQAEHLKRKLGETFAPSQVELDSAHLHICH